MQITYQKQDGCIFQRIRNTTLPYKIGDTTSMGWKVLNIEYKFGNKYYSEYEYNKRIHQIKTRIIKKQQIKELCLQELKVFLQFIILLIIFYYIKK